jgi:hypothetical protein
LLAPIETVVITVLGVVYLGRFSLCLKSRKDVIPDVGGIDGPGQPLGQPKRKIEWLDFLVFRDDKRAGPDVYFFWTARVVSSHSFFWLVVKSPAEGDVSEVSGWDFGNVKVADFAFVLAV